MKKAFMFLLVLLFTLPFTGAAQNSNVNTNAATAPRAGNTNSGKKRGPVFRANKDQIKQAQAILKERGFYSGEQT
jgi:hypothetical protein